MLRALSLTALLVAVMAVSVEAQIISNPVLTTQFPYAAAPVYDVPAVAPVCTPPVVSFYNPCASPCLTRSNHILSPRRSRGDHVSTAQLPTLPLNHGLCHSDGSILRAAATLSRPIGFRRRRTCDRLLCCRLCLPRRFMHRLLGCWLWLQLASRSLSTERPFDVSMARRCTWETKTRLRSFVSTNF